MYNKSEVEKLIEKKRNGFIALIWSLKTYLILIFKER